MNENIDLTKILEGCPKGTEFYSSVHGKLKYLSMYISSSASKISFIQVNSRSIVDGTPIIVNYYRDGTLYYNEGECIVFPSKDQRDWAKFERFWDKPKIEKFSPNTLQPFDKVLVRNSYDYKWVCDFFSFIIDEDVEYKYMCVSSSNKYCIPYNDDTKHLLNTTDLPLEYYIYWEGYPKME